MLTIENICWNCLEHKPNMLIAIYQGHTYTQTHKIQKYFQIQLLIWKNKITFIRVWHARDYVGCIHVLVTLVSKHNIFFNNLKVRLKEADRFCHLELGVNKVGIYSSLGLCHFYLLGLTSKHLFLYKAACLLVFVPGTPVWYPAETYIRGL